MIEKCVIANLIGHLMLALGGVERVADVSLPRMPWNTLVAAVRRRQDQDLLVGHFSDSEGTGKDQYG